MRIAVVTGGPVDPRASASQGRVSALVHHLLELGQRVVHAHLAPAGYDRAPFLRGLAAVYPALRLAGPAGAAGPPAELAGCDLTVLSDLWSPGELAAAAAVARRLARPVVFDSMDCLAATFAGTRPPDRVRELAAREAEVRQLAAACVFVSRGEALKAARHDPAGVDLRRAFVLPTCHSSVGPGRPFADRRHVCFVGSPAPHNAAAVAVFARRVWPRLAGLLPDAEFHLVGGIGAAVRVDGPAELAGRVRAVGAVDDLPAALGRYRVSVVPVVSGSGIKGKLLDSLAAGTPVVSTVAGAEGLPVEHHRHLLLAAADDGFADAVAAAYTDERLWGHLAAEGRRLVRRRFSPAAFRRRVRRLVALFRRLCPAAEG